MSANLSKSDEFSLQRGSSAAIVEHLHRTKHHLNQGRWLGTRNVYRLSPVVAIRDRDPSTGRDRPRQLGDYVAASCPLHLWDGWNYLGLAVHAHLRGSIGNATHLAYYAELRAAMSLLASQGIGVFGRQHCVIDAPGSVVYLARRGTHEAARLYLEHWSDRGAAASLLSRILSMDQASVDEWLRHLRHAGAWAPLGRELTQQAGLDLRRMSDDLIARNEASYRPTDIVPSPAISAVSDADFLVDMVRLLEPGGPPGAFEILDRFLCRRLIERSYLAGSGRSSVSEFPDYRRAIESMVATFIDSSMRREELARFLVRETEPLDPRLLLEAERDGDQGDQDYHLQIMGRATILLRIATGAVRELLSSADLSLESLNFWWQPAGTLQGLWETPPSVVNSSELWVDAFEGLGNIDQWIRDGFTSRKTLLTTCAEPIFHATGMARFALIGLAS